MKRPHLVIAVNIIQLLLTLLVAATSVYVLSLTRSHETLQEPDAADTIRGLIIGAAVLGVPALFLITALWGLWRNKLWGWWLALVTDLVIVATLAYSMKGQNSSDLTEPAWTLCFVVCAILLLLPKVRQFYWARKV